MNFTSFFMEALVRILEISIQASILVGLVLLVQLLLGKWLTPAWRYGLWLLVVLRLIAPSLPTSPWSVHRHFEQETALFSTTSMPIPLLSGRDLSAISESQQGFTPRSPMRTVSQSMTPQEVLNTPVSHHTELRKDALSNPTVNDLPMRWDSILSFQIVIPFLWLGVVLLMFGMRIWEFRKYRRILHGAVPIHDPAMLRLHEHAKSLSNVKSRIGLYESNQISSPAIAGLTKPVILLPSGMTDRYSESEIRHILLHEMAHWRRGDLHVNALFTLLMILHWFNPILWFAWHRMRLDREMATDALALQFAGDNPGKAYGETLVKLLDDASRSNAIPGMVGILESKFLN